MKHVSKVLPLVALALVVSVALAQPGSGYDLSWWTVDGGGGTLAGNGYSLSSTAGQLDAAAWSGEGYTLAGGFWGEVGPGEYNVYLPLALSEYP